MKNETPKHPVYNEDRYIFGIIKAQIIDEQHHRFPASPKRLAVICLSAEQIKDYEKTEFNVLRRALWTMHKDDKDNVNDLKCPECKHEWQWINKDNEIELDKL